MTTDRELLELAAKAAGITYDPGDKSEFGLRLVIDFEPSEHARRRWNPLTDDGDAQRLTVKLGIEIQVIYPRDRIELGRSRANSMWQLHGIDPYAATRRAIVRAAADIGKAML